MEDFIVVIYGLCAIVVVTAPYIIVASALMMLWASIKRRLRSRPRHSPFQYYRRKK